MESKVDPKFPLKVQRICGGERRLIEELKVVDLQLSETVKNLWGTVDHKKQTITVNPGFVTDYSSIPPGFRWFIFWSRVDVAGVVHDFLYTLEDFPRAEADAIWRKLAQSGDHCVGAFRSWVGWLILRIFGAHRKAKPPTSTPVKNHP